MDDCCDLTKEIKPIKRRSQIRRYKSVDGLFLEPIDEIPRVSTRTKSFDFGFDDLGSDEPGIGNHVDEEIVDQPSTSASVARKPDLIHGDSFADAPTGEVSYLCDDSSDDEDDDKDRDVRNLPLYRLSFDENDFLNVGDSSTTKTNEHRKTIQQSISDDDISFLPPVARTLRSYSSRGNSMYRGTSFDTVELNEKPKVPDSENFGRYVTPVNSLHASDSFVLQHQNLHHEKCVIRPEKFLTADHSFRLPLIRGLSSHCSNDGPMFARMAAKKSMVSRVNSMKPTRRSSYVPEIPLEKPSNKCTVTAGHGHSLDDLTKKLEQIVGMAEPIVTWDIDDESQEFCHSPPPCFGLKRKESIKRRFNIPQDDQNQTAKLFHQSFQTLETEDTSVFSSEKDSESDYNG